MNCLNQFPKDTDVTLKNAEQLDAFSRLRTSQPSNIFDYKQIVSNHTNDLFLEDLTGSGTATYQYDRSSTYLTCTTASGDKVIRQSKMYCPYIPGKSQLIVMTAIFGAAKANVDQYVGYGDGLNGLFFTYQSTTFGVLIRTATSGSAVDTFIAQSFWNIDTMDGSGPSGVTVDTTKTQIYIIDFQWLGVGRVRFSLDIDGIIYPVHEVLNANNLAVTYMKTPSLPVRYEIENTGVAASNTTLEQICCSVSSEGGYIPPGAEYSQGNGITTVAVTTRAPILAIRLKSAFPAGEPNRTIVRLLDYLVTTSTNNAYFEISRVTDPISTTGGSWTDVSAESAVQYNAGITAVTGGTEFVLKNIPVSTSGFLGLGRGIGQDEITFINSNGFIFQNIDSSNSDLIVVYATPFTGTANVTASLNWVEIR
jgi:hypothetical protein